MLKQTIVGKNIDYLKATAAATVTEATSHPLNQACQTGGPQWYFMILIFFYSTNWRNLMEIIEDIQYNMLKFVYF